MRFFDLHLVCYRYIYQCVVIKHEALPEEIRAHALGPRLCDSDLATMVQSLRECRKPHHSARAMPH